MLQKQCGHFMNIRTITFEDLITPFSFPELTTESKICSDSVYIGNGNRGYGILRYHRLCKQESNTLWQTFNITPDVAIVDSELVEGLPAKQVAYTGMDALTHAIEAYVSTLNCVYTDPLAIQAIEMVSRLPAGILQPEIWKQEQQMHYAQCLAGMAFSNALLGIVHSMAHKTGAVILNRTYSHMDRANAMYLPYVIKYNAKDTSGCITLCRDCTQNGTSWNIRKSSDQQLVCRRSMQFNAKTEHSYRHLKEFGINEEEFKEKTGYRLQNLQLVMPVQDLIQEQLILQQWLNYLHVHIMEQKLIFK